MCGDAWCVGGNVRGMWRCECGARCGRRVAMWSGHVQSTVWDVWMAAVGDLKELLLLFWSYDAPHLEAKLTCG